MQKLLYVCLSILCLKSQYSWAVPKEIRESKLKDVVLPWVYKKDTTLKKHMSGWNDERIASYARVLAQKIGTSKAYRGISEKERQRINAKHMIVISKILKEERNHLRAEIEKQMESIVEKMDSSAPVDLQGERDKRMTLLMTHIKRATKSDDLPPLSRAIHHGIETEMRHRAHLAMHCPGLILPNERFLQKWQELSQRSLTSGPDLKRFLGLLIFIEELNRQAELSPPYQAYLRGQKNNDGLYGRIHREKQRLLENYRMMKENQKNGTRLCDVLCSDAALDMLKQSLTPTLEPEQKQVIRGHFQSIQNFPEWGETLIESIFSPSEETTTPMQAKILYNTLVSINNALSQKYDEKSAREILEKFILNYPQKIKVLEIFLNGPAVE